MEGNCKIKCKDPSIEPVQLFLDRMEGKDLSSLCTCLIVDFVRTRVNSTYTYV